MQITGSQCVTEDAGQGLVACSTFPEGRTVGEYHLQALKTTAKVITVWDYVRTQQAELTVADVMA